MQAVDCNVDNRLHGHEYWEIYEKAEPHAVDYAPSYGLMDIHPMMRHIHEYLNVLNIKECLNNEKYILKILAVFDRRVGKRAIKKLADNISNEPEWFRKYIILRAECECIEIVTKA